MSLLFKAYDCLFYDRTPPLPFPDSMEHARKLMVLNKCYFSGYGIDNENKPGNLHSVKTPLNVNVAPMEHMEGPYLLIQFINDVSAPLMKKSGDERIIDRILETDPIGRKNGYKNGDSGGSLICLDESDIPFLLGVTTRESQTVSLLNNDIMYKWIKTK